jgi:hypothetical protein
MTMKSREYSVYGQFDRPTAYPTLLGTYDTHSAARERVNSLREGTKWVETNLIQLEIIKTEQTAVGVWTNDDGPNWTHAGYPKESRSVAGSAAEEGEE